MEVIIVCHNPRTIGYVFEAELVNDNEIKFTQCPRHFSIVNHYPEKEVFDIEHLSIHFEYKNQPFWIVDAAINASLRFAEILKQLKSL